MYNQYIEPESQNAEEAGIKDETLTETQNSSTGLLQLLKGVIGKMLPSSKSGKGEGILSGIPILEGLDTGDILLVLILIYLFRESEDEEWLIILALVLLMGL